MLNALINFCYSLDRNTPYKRVKKSVYYAIEDPQSRIKPVFDIAMISIVVTSVFFLVYDVKHPSTFFSTSFEWFAIIVFIIEYILRFWVYNDTHKIVIEHHENAEFIGRPVRPWPLLKEILEKKWEYVTTPIAIIDLLAILPAYRPLRILRILLLFRLFKLFRYTRSVNEFAKVLTEKRVELYTLAVVSGFLILSSATAFYIFEGDKTRDTLEGFLHAVYWSLVTVSTVGYGDIIPHTPEGRFIAVMLIISGIGVLAFSTSIIVSAFSEKMRELGDHRTLAEIERRGSFIMICGYGRVGKIVANQLKAKNEMVLVVDKNPAVVEQAKADGHLVLQDDAGRNDLWTQLNLRDRAKQVLCLTQDDIANVYITLTARYFNPDINIISRANEEATITKLENAGANYVITPFKTVGLVAAESLGQAVAFEAIYGMLSGYKNISIEPVIIPKDSMLDNVMLGRIDFQKYKLVFFGVITQNISEEDQENEKPFPLKKTHFYFNPRKEFILKHTHLVIVIGHRLSIAHFREQLRNSSLEYTSNV